MNYLCLEFREAGWFPRLNKFSRDYCSDITGRYKRKIVKQYKEPITYHQISGMLHVLMGERPKPSLRKTLFNDIPEIKELAKNSFIKIETPYKYINKNKKETYITEIMRVKKVIWNSFLKGGDIYWERLFKFLEDELFIEFINICELLGIKNPKDMILNHLLKEISEKYKDNDLLLAFIEKLKENGKTPFGNLLFDPENKEVRTTFNSNVRTFLTINGGIEYITRLSGKIIIPLPNEKWVNKIKNGKGFAKLLDGGLVTISDLIPEYRFSEEQLNGFTNLNEIGAELI